MYSKHAKIIVAAIVVVVMFLSVCPVGLLVSAVENLATWLVQPSLRFYRVSPEGFIYDGYAEVAVCEDKECRALQAVYINEKGEEVAYTYQQAQATRAARRSGDSSLLITTTAPDDTLIYDAIRDFSDDMARVAVSDADGRDKYGFIDKTGKLVIPAEFLGANDFNEGMAAVSNQDGKWGFINKTGALVIPYQYERFSHRYFGYNRGYRFTDGLCWVIKVTGDRSGDFDEENIARIENQINELRRRAEESAKKIDRAELERQAKELDQTSRQLQQVYGKMDPKRMENAIRERVMSELRKMGVTEEMMRKMEQLESRYSGFALTDKKAISELEKAGFDEKTINALKEFSEKVKDPAFLLGIMNEQARTAADPANAEKMIKLQTEFITEVKELTSDQSNLGMAMRELRELGGELSERDRAEYAAYMEAMASEPQYLIGVIDKTGATVLPFEYDEITEIENNLALVRKGDVWGIVRFGPEPPPNTRITPVVTPISSTVATVAVVGKTVPVTDAGSTAADKTETNTDQKTMNNDSVIKLVQAGFSEDLVVSTINASPGDYDTSVDAIIALKTAGVGDKALAAIVAKTKNR